MVILGHTIAINGDSKLWVDPISKIAGYTYSGSIAVKIFFFISGLVVTNSLIKKRNPISYILSRIFRIMPALIMVLFCSAFVIGPLLTNLSIKEYFNSSQTYRYVINNLMFRPDYSLPGIFQLNYYKNAVNGSLWTLLFEVRCYIVLLCIYIFTKNERIWNIIAITIILDSVLPSRVVITWLGSNPEVNLLPVCFSFGSLLAINSEKIDMNLWHVLGAVLLAWILKGSSNAQIAFVFAACIVTLYLSTSKFLIQIKPKYDISYGIYLWGF